MKKSIDNIVENLFYALPVIHKRLMKIDPPDIRCGIHLSRLHIGIMAFLSENAAPISEVADTFLVPRPQMTYLINLMEKAGLVKKIPDKHDRRITNATLTPKGQKIFKVCDEHIKNNVRTMLAELTEEELKEFSLSLKKLKEIGPRLGTRNQ
jgi:MarR family 2-MHQ and catechol resistance regulon transcriptional repressor